MIADAFPKNPVIGLGGILHPDQAEQVLADGVQLVGLGRALLLDANWARKVHDGKINELKLKLNNPEEVWTLEIPEPMKEYSKSRF